MTTRRHVSQEKSSLEKSDDVQRFQGSDVTPAVPAWVISTVRCMLQLMAYPSAVIIKLLLFTLAMVAAPIGTYYATVDTVFKG